MNFQQLRTFRELTRQGYNLTEMASVSHTTQPGLSRQIRDLESEMRFTIFTRQGNRITGLTDAGKTMLGIVERLLAEADQLLEAGHAYATTTEGALTIATTHTQARYALPRPVSSFRAAFPQVRVQIQQSLPEYIGKAVVSGEADIGIATAGLAKFPELVTFPCHRWTHQAVVPQGHPLLSRGPLTLEDLAAYPLLTYDQGYSGRHQMDEAFAHAGIVPNIVLSAMDSDVIKQYVSLGFGVGLLASISVDAELDPGLHVIDTGSLFKTSTTLLAVRRGAYLRSYTYGFIRHFAPQLTRQQIDAKLGNDSASALAALEQREHLLAKAAYPNINRSTADTVSLT